MKKVQIRQGVFETNSSSTHSITIVTEKEWDRFVNGELVLDYRELVEVTDENKNDEDFETYEDFSNNEYLEHYITYFTTPSGDKMVAFGKYGYNG